MKFRHSLFLYLNLALVLSAVPVWAQRPQGPDIGKTRSSAPTGPSIGKSAAEENSSKAEQGRAFNLPKVKVVRVPTDKGYLALVTVPDAKVIITPLNDQNEPGKPLPAGIAKLGLVTFSNIAPGNYKLEVTCEGYEPLNDFVTVAKGRATERVAPLASKFAILRVGLGKQAGQDIVVKMDGQPFPPLRVEAGQLVFEQVPVGKRTFNFIKSGFSEWTLDLDIRPGNNFVSATMDVETIAVTVKTQPRAEVYVDDEQKREASEAGELKLNLPLGEHRLRVTMPGFDPAGQTLNLAREPRALTVQMMLTPIAEDAAFDEPFNPQVKTWTPFPLPVGWQLQTTRPKGLRLAGEAPAFVFNTSLPNRSFNIYKDFDLVMNVRLTDGKGLAWIVRAQDDKNYYLFELDNEKKELLFSLYRNGQRQQIRVAGTVVSLEKDRPYRIILEARGNQFRHLIVLDDPNDPKPLGILFEDSTHAFGGIGLRAFNGGEVLIDQFSILKPKQ